MLEFLIIFIIIIWIVPKLIKMYLVHFVKKQTRRMYDQMNNTAYQDENSGNRQRKAGWSKPPKRRKKIDPTIGEYVKFQEISVTESSETSNTDNETYHTIESQVTDAVWEDIK